MRFERVAEARVSAGFLSGDDYRAPPIASREQIADLSPGRQFFDDLSRSLAREFGVRKADADADAAVSIHARMRGVPRSAAVQAGFWHQVTLLDAQRYVRWRWIGGDGAVPVARMLSRGAAPWRNGLARLWWVGEICGGDDSKIRLVCGVQQAIDSVVDQRISANLSWVDALCLRLQESKWGTREVKLACRIGNQIARTRLLADLAKEELADSIDRVMEKLDSATDPEL